MRTKKITQLAALMGLAMLGATGVASAADVKQGPFACPVDTTITAGKLAATCTTYGFYNPEDNPQTDDLTKVQGLYPTIDTFYDKDEGEANHGVNDGNFYLTGPAFGAISYGNTTSGFFLISDTLLGQFGQFVLVLKGGNEDPSWVAFEFMAANLIAGAGNQAGFSYGTWSSGRQGLSHASLYVGGEPTGDDDDDDDDDTDLPEPGSLALLGLGLLGLGMSRRRKL